MNGQSLVKALIPLPGQSTAVYTDSGFLASTFLGNPFSSLIQAGQDLTSHLFGNAANNTSRAVGSFAATPVANRVPNIAFAATVAATTSVQTSGFSATTSVAGRISGTVPLGSLARVGAGALDALGFVLVIPVSATVTSFSAVVCSIGR